MDNNFDCEYYEKYSEDVINGSRFDNNYTCWRILSIEFDKGNTNNPHVKSIQELKSMLNVNFEENRVAFLNLLTLIEYKEWLLYLQKVHRFIARGLIYNSISPSCTLSELCIDKFERRFQDIKFVSGLRTDLLNGNQDIAGQILDYSDNQDRFTILDVSLALNIYSFIHHAIAKGCEKYMDDLSYIIPTLSLYCNNLADNAIPMFGVSLVSHSSILKSFQKEKSRKKQQNQLHYAPEQSGGIFNTFTGEIVKPKDDGFYIDDFR